MVGADDGAGGFHCGHRRVDHYGSGPAALYGLRPADDRGVTLADCRAGGGGIVGGVCAGLSAPVRHGPPLHPKADASAAGGAATAARTSDPHGRPSARSGDGAGRIGDGAMIDLPFIWGVLIAFAVLAYVILDGFDLGIGILFPWLKRGGERDTAMNSVAPVWDGNETW